MLTIHALALSLALYLRTSSGFSFTINNTPQQCSDLNISVIGSGQPPYSAVIVPYGSTPLPNNIDVRNVLDVPFSGVSTSTSFKLTYPENSQFVVVVSDSTGFGTGGASIAVQVQTGSSDSSCYGNSEAYSLFAFSTTPDNQLSQCTPTRIWWDFANTQGSVQFYGVIPGGQCFPLNEGTFSNVSGAGYGFNCTVPVQAGTTVLVVGGDSRGIGSGGWEQIVINPSDSYSCLDSSSPSSTPGSPAGVSYSTSSTVVITATAATAGSGSSTNGSSSKSNKDVIIGGAAAGGLIIIAINVLVCLCFIRRRRRTIYDSPVDLLQGNVEPLSPGLNQIPHFYQQEAFRAPDTTTVFSHGRQSYDPHQLTEASTTHSLSRTGLDITAMSPSYGIQSYNSHKSMETYRTTFLQHSGTPEPGGLGRGSTSSRSSPTQNSSLVPGQLHPVNVIYHDDAGTVNERSAIPETIEFPPAYSNIRNTLPQ